MATAKRATKSATKSTPTKKAAPKTKEVPPEDQPTYPFDGDTRPVRLQVNDHPWLVVVLYITGWFSESDSKAYIDFTYRHYQWFDHRDAADEWAKEVEEQAKTWDDDDDADYYAVAVVETGDTLSVKAARMVNVVSTKLTTAIAHAVINKPEVSLFDEGQTAKVKPATKKGPGSAVKGRITEGNAPEPKASKVRHQKRTDEPVVEAEPEAPKPQVRAKRPRPTVADVAAGTAPVVKSSGIRAALRAKKKSA